MTLNFAMTLALSCFLLVCGCNRETPPPAQPRDPAVSTSKDPQSPTQKTSDVVKIVFVGQKNACECTRTRIDTSWKTLQGVLGKRDDIAIEQIQLDVDEEQAEKMDNIRSLMVTPGIYFFDANEHLLEMLQGEVTAEQISKVL